MQRFDNDQLSVVFFLQDDPPAPYIYIRTRKDHNEPPWVSVLGAHELVISRDPKSDATLVLSRWSARNQKPKPWARLQFTTWEGRLVFCFLLGSLLYTKFRDNARKEVSSDWLTVPFRAELVLFHWTFVALKADSPLVVNMHPNEFKLHHETSLFMA
ncbi:hypothetical protein SLS62_002519 [Diatrype stigma]|uniref:PH domain-containing protein n=1 Tax=Diatrype stigma TaxID=117547 RepID=A0AAN9YV82_9PEZI